MEKLNITEQAVAAVTFKDLKYGLSQFNKAGLGEKVTMEKGAKKWDYARAIVRAVKAAEAANKAGEVPQATQQVYSVLAPQQVEQPVEQPVQPEDAGTVLKKAKGVVRQGRGLTGVTRPVAFTQVLAQYAGQTVRRPALNKAMWELYGSSDMNSAWWVGVYLQLLCAMGHCTEVSRGTFKIGKGLKEVANG